MKGEKEKYWITYESKCNWNDNDYYYYIDNSNNYVFKTFTTHCKISTLSTGLQNVWAKSMSPIKTGMGLSTVYANPNAEKRSGECCTYEKAKKRPKVYSWEMKKPWIVCQSLQWPISCPKMANSSSRFTCFKSVSYSTIRWKETLNSR